jgi:NAD(P)-dependent dehydrogenase (short-subunit alcohol dehydrogenase family)
VNIKDAVVLVTGGNRGLGQSLVQEVLKAGARKVYVGARTLTETSDARIHQLKLDITSEQDVAAAVEACQDVTILINNAGQTAPASLVERVALEVVREEMEINYFGTLRVIQAFVPVLKQNGGGMIVNILSQLSWFALPTLVPYSASKAAAMLLTEGIRMELKPQGTQVVAVYTGFMDTAMFAHVNFPKFAPEVVAANTIQGILAGQEEILADTGLQNGAPTSQDIKASLANDRAGFYQNVQGFGAYTQGS